MEQMSKKEFIKKCILNRPNENYDFSLVDEQLTQHSKVKIICLKHNITFEVNAFDFCKSNKIVCSECKIEKATEEFINKSKAIWGDNVFDYSKTRYVNNRTKIVLICKKHNIEFKQVPSSHLKHINGCPYCCNKTGIYSKETFIDFFENKYPGLYDYSLVEYIDNYTCVKIICKKHNFIFERNVYDFKRHSCPICGKENKVAKYTQEEFIAKALTICGDYFDLSLVEYKGIHVPVKVICPVHGIIEMTPYLILLGTKCRYCQGKANYTTEEFIKLAIKFRGEELYDYSLVKYVNIRTKIKIICKIHNIVFEAYPLNFLKGSRCPICNNLMKHSNESFIAKSREVHGDLYDYSKINYVNSRTLVEIICKKHGSFFQTPHNHLSGLGCPFCCNSKLEEEIKVYLTNRSIKFIPQMKFEWLKHKSYLKIDFYLPDFDVAIECLGELHFNTYYHDNTYDDFLERQLRDRLKYQQCKEHNIVILYYSDKHYVDEYEFGYVYINPDDLLQEILKHKKS